MVNNAFLQKNKLVNSILKKKTYNCKSKESVYKFMTNVSVGICLYLDYRFKFISRFLPYSWFFSYVDIFLMFYCLFEALTHLYIFAYHYINPEVIEVKPIEQKLFGIKETDVGFKSTTPKSVKEKSLAESFVLPSHQVSNNLSSMLSSCSLERTASWSGSPNVSLNSSSWVYNSNPSPMANNQETILKNRFQSVFSVNQTSPATATQSSPAQSNYFNQRDSFGTPQSQTNGINSIHSPSFTTTPENASFWNYPKANMNFTPMMNNSYQMASRSPQASTNKDGPMPPNYYSFDLVLNHLKVKDEQLTNYIENLRHWISQTILSPVSNEIDSINVALNQMGSPELQIGEISLSMLKQVLSTKGVSNSNAAALFPYLDLTTNQEYLVHRIKELAKGGCISEFCWNGGGTFKGKPWTDDLPTDSVIVFHVFCVYMNSRLPADPQYPDGKSFTAQYFKEKDKKLPLNKDLFYIYQAHVSPSHYQVVLGETLLDIPKGRVNLFCAIIVFINYIKVTQSGMLTRVNLGPSGINILNVLESH